MSSRPGDTSSASWRAQLGILSSMAPAARVKAALELSDWVRETQIQGILTRHAGWSRREAVQLVSKRVANGGIETP